jgi:hypothetical protein
MPGTLVSWTMMLLGAFTLIRRVGRTTRARVAVMLLGVALAFNGAAETFSLRTAYPVMNTIGWILFGSAIVVACVDITAQMISRRHKTG